MKQGHYDIPDCRIEGLRVEHKRIVGNDMVVVVLRRDIGFDIHITVQLESTSGNRSHEDRAATAKALMSFLEQEKATFTLCEHTVGNYVLLTESTGQYWGGWKSHTVERSK